ncbi:type II toxin-antitoxin system VapC family toxin [bacterium]|nr:MAG: type II toxin-antitoxin system VapC family toxin [bacterium]
MTCSMRSKRLAGRYVQKSLSPVPKALVDTSTYFDIQRAVKNRRREWAQNSLRNLTKYRAHHSRLTISAFTSFEILDGLHRRSGDDAARSFSNEVVPFYEVIYPDESIVAIAADIHAALAGTRQLIGLADTFIAATAVSEKLTLVTANVKHFERIQEMGYSIALENWREV